MLRTSVQLKSFSSVILSVQKIKSITACILLYKLIIFHVFKTAEFGTHRVYFGTHKPPFGTHNGTHRICRYSVINFTRVFLYLT